MRLDTVRVGAADVEVAVARYRTLLGVDVVAVGRRRRFQLGRGAIEIVAGEPGIREIVFARDGDTTEWPGDPASVAGLAVRVEDVAATDVVPLALDAVSAIDHVVVFTGDPERAIAIWRDRRGLRLAFDRTFPERRLRLLFFRSGGMTLELACPLPAAGGEGPDRFYGVSYRVPDLAARRAALLAAGVSVSEIRAGNKPGTRVATVRDHTADVPTLLLEAEPR